METEALTYFDTRLMDQLAKMPLGLTFVWIQLCSISITDSDQPGKLAKRGKPIKTGQLVKLTRQTRYLIVSAIEAAETAKLAHVDENGFLCIDVPFLISKDQFQDFINK